MISINQAFEIMERVDQYDRKIPFDLVFYTCNLETGIAGEKKVLTGVELVGSKAEIDMKRSLLINVKPSHLPKARPTFVHFHLIESVNGQEVMPR